MIPQFPEFKVLELSDREDVEKFTLKYPPYSDFNFAGTWSWDVQGKMKISQLNGNYVIRFIDYLTGVPFYTFLGNNNVNDAAKKLLDLSIKEGLGAQLKLVPEDSIGGIDRNIFKVEEDPNHHDYIIPVEIFEEYNTKETKSNKNAAKKFLEDFSPHKTILDISDEETKKSIFTLYKKWSANRKGHDIRNEWDALKRVFEVSEGEYVCLGIFLGKELIGFCFNELLPNNFSCIHFSKSDTSISGGIYAYLLQENAKLLIEKGVKLINLEQDLGIPGLKKWKMSYGVNMFLKKYNIKYNDNII